MNSRVEEDGSKLFFITVNILNEYEISRNILILTMLCVYKRMSSPSKRNQSMAPKLTFKHSIYGFLPQLFN